MNTTPIVALLVALGTGAALGVQATANSSLGARIGPVTTGLLDIIVGGALALVIFVLFRARLTTAGWPAIRGASFGVTLAGVLAVVAIAGTAFALPRVGVAAGISAIILGQMLVALVVDSTGWGGVERFPLSITRLAGLVLMAIAVWLVVPRGS